MNISYFLHISKILRSVFGSVSLPDGTIFKYESKLTCCNWKFFENFVFLKTANNGSLKANCCFESRARWNALAKNWLASRQENGFFEVWPVGLFIFVFTNGGCTCFYEEKTKIIARAKRANHKTAASSKISLLFAQKHGLHLTQLIWSHFLQKYGNNAQFFS